MLWMTVKALRAPLTTTVCGLALFGMISATSNALYMQPVDHPAPFFTDKALVTSSLPPVAPPMVVATPRVSRNTTQPARVSTPIAPSPATPRAIAEIGHDDIKLMQDKLRAVGLYEGEADGFYGPKTAAAIRRFEGRNGLPEIGALTPQILNHIINQSQPIASAQPINNAPTSRLVTVENVVQQIAADVESSGNKLMNAASQAQRRLRTQIESAQPDRLTQIVQQVASAAPAGNTTLKQSPPAPNVGDKTYVKKVQRGLASLGFLHGEIDGVAGEGTARAIRNFEVYYNYKVSGAITPELLDLLVDAGAVI